MSDRWVKVAGIASGSFLLALAIFTYGLAVGYYQLWPFGTIRAVRAVALSYLKYGEVVPDNRRHVAAPDAPRARFAIHAPALRAGGHYAFLGWDESRGSYAAWLYDADGSLVHTWVVDYDALDPDGPSNGSDAPHAFHVLADGSIIVGFDRGDVMARLDRCSVPVWIRPGIFHHAMEPAEDGSIWTWHASGTAYGHYHYLENFDPETGEHIKGLALVEDIIAKSDLAATIMAVPSDYQFREFVRDPEDELDIFHPNDIEEVSAGFAEHHSMFEAGDLMLGFKNINLVLIVDHESYDIKWWSHGPWRFQHDPDLRSDGKISVYDNNPDRGSSQILTIDPSTREVSNDLSDMTFSFYSEFRGKHQYLPNGNLIIVVPEEGRVIEVTRNGRKVLEFNNISPFRNEYNEDVENAMWLEPGYFHQVPTCRHQP
jgi:hypothetical protein